MLIVPPRKLKVGHISATKTAQLSCFFVENWGLRAIESAGLIGFTANSIPTAPTNLLSYQYGPNDVVPWIIRPHTERRQRVLASPTSKPPSRCPLNRQFD